MIRIPNSFLLLLVRHLLLVAMHLFLIASCFYGNINAIWELSHLRFLEHQSQVPVEEKRVKLHASQERICFALRCQPQSFNKVRSIGCAF